MSDEEKQEDSAALDIESLGPYTIESHLGQGGMGIVYLATDKGLGREVAIKVLHPHLLRHENLKQRFRREARMHAKLMHPNIVTLLSLFENDEHMALVMEVVNGDDLKTFLRKNPDLSIKKTLIIGAEILKGLDAAHSFGMVHRDLKPANVLISDKGQVKLLDFGLAKPETGDDDLTQSGATVGSFRYMAPEQILNDPIDARTDLYAFGILLFYMLVGKLPFDSTGSGGEFEIMEKQVREAAPNPHELDSNIPEELSLFVLKLLEKNKVHRPANAKAALQTIEKISEALNTLVKQPKRAKPSKQKQAKPPSALSRHDIASQWLSFGKFHFKKIFSKYPLLQGTFSQLSLIALVFIVLGSLSIVMLNMAEANISKLQKEKSAQQPILLAQQEVVAKEVVQKKEVVKKSKVAKKVIKQKLAPAVKTTPKAKPKKKAQIKPKYKPKKRIRKSVTYNARHTVTRKDKTKVSSNKPHEFRGGSHVFYPGLAKKSWLSSFKRGDSTVLFDKPISLSKVVIHKASVGNLDFNHGFIEVEVKPAGKRKWKKVFSQKDKDIDRKVVIQGFKKDYPSLDGVRIKFKTQDPITIGPIDLLQ